jgi:hypothetical protein
MLTLLTQYSAVLLLIGIALALLALRNTIRYFSQSRRARYYILREEAMRGAGRWFVASLVCIALTIGLALFASRAQPAPEVEPTATATRAVPTLESPTVIPTAAPTRTPTPIPTSTPALTPTVALAPELPAVLLTPIPGAVTPNPAARFEFVTLASRVDSNLNPIDPGLQFPIGTTRVFLYFRAVGVNNGSPWAVVCFREGKVVDVFTDLWKDGPRTQTARAFCSLDGSAGTIRLRAYLGTQPAFEVQFTLAGTSTSTPPPVPTQPATATPSATPKPTP